ncbi:sulfotransferase [Thiocapsa bogorovii]|uniref:sulfotransferase n=1 Tax=Thiocapsa bogorovii TaxID=521689 RepID=UPI001E5D79D3|nr:sulfotransferase [Thiocapsa bogorovii]UHD14546.1 sulfotransferase [Thiocapsa bogorovii]
MIEKYVFIVTYGRSGSTLLQAVLNSIQGYCIRGENNLAILPLYRSTQRLLKAKQDYRVKPIPSNHPWYGLDNIDLDRYTRSLVDAFVTNVLIPPADCRVCGFKEIRYYAAEEITELLDFFRTAFTDSRIVFNTRDALAVARSRWNAKMDQAAVVESVHRMDAVFADYQAKHPEQTYLVLYDQYAKDPSKLEGLFDFLGEAFDPVIVGRVLSEKLMH